MRRTTLLLASMALVVLLASGVALAIAKQCKPNVKCVGTENTDRLTGTKGSDRIYGLQKYDRLYGEGGSDRLFGGRGSDVLNGGDGEDKLFAGRDGAYLNGGADDQKKDVLTGEAGIPFEHYRFQGAWGEDIVIDSLSGSHDNFYRNDVDFSEVSGNLVVNVESDSGPLPEATDGTNTVNWDGNVIGNVEVSDSQAGLISYTLKGDAGSNRFFVVNSGGGSAGGDDTISGEGGPDTIDNVDTSGNDTISGGGGEDSIGNTNSGNDTISGGGAQDFISNDDEDGDEDDNIFADAGDDIVEAYDGGGNDTISGGDGEDFLRVHSTPDATPTLNTVTISGGKGEDGIYNKRRHGTLSGDAGDDRIVAYDDGRVYEEPGNSTVFGGDGSDTIWVSDGFSGDTVECGEDLDGNDIDTVYFDEGDVISPDCERQNP